MIHNTPKILSILIVVLLYMIGFNSPHIQAEEKVHHKSHVHGAAHLNVAFENNELYIEFISPAANIVGFEHQPKTEKQKAAVRDAIKMLKAGQELFVISKRAGAKLISSDVNTELELEHGHEAEDVHEDEAGEHHSEADHHGEDDEEHAHEEDGHETHSEFMAVYRFACQKPDNLNHIDVMLFQQFKGIETIDAQIVTRTITSALELTAKRNRINLPGSP